MLLDIIVPHYKEEWFIVERFFKMLDLQRNIDFKNFRVLLVHDGKENAFPEKNFSNKPYMVKQISIDHNGVSAARNAGLSFSDAEWVMFCDCDDMFAHPFAMMDIVHSLEKDELSKKTDVLWTDILLENKEHCVYKKYGFNMIFVHGKVFSRKFVENKKLLFDTDLEYSEDVLFVSSACIYAGIDRIGQIVTQIPSYIWCNNFGSVSRSTEILDKVPWNIYHCDLKLCKLYLEEKPYEEYARMVVRTITDAYVYLNRSELSERNKELKNNFKLWYLEHKKEWDHVSIEMKRKIKAISIGSMKKREQDGVLFDISVTKWLSNLTND